jgi:hypothetical protein
MQQIFEQLVSMFIPFVALTFGLVEFVKKQLGLEGNQATWASFIIGVVIGGLFFAVHLFPGVAVYIAGFVFVIATGLVASGFYDFGTRNE